MEKMINPEAQVRVNPADLEDIVCECGCPYFHQAYLVKKVPGFLSPNGQPSIGPFEVLLCARCGTDVATAFQKSLEPKISLETK